MTSFLATMAAHGAGVPDDLSQLGVCTSTLRADPFSCTPDDLQSIITASGLAGFHTASLWRMHYEMAKAGGLRDGDMLQWLAEAEMSVLHRRSRASHGPTASATHSPKKPTRCSRSPTSSARRICWR